MPVVSYHFRFGLGHGHTPVSPLPPDLLHRLSERLHVGEWLCVSMPGFCTLYLADGDYPDEKTIASILRSEGLLPTIAEHIYATDRTAIHLFLEAATGTAPGQDNPKSIELYQEAFAQAIELGFAGSVFQKLFQKALWLYEKVRLDTEFMQFAVRTETAVRELAEKILGTLAKTSATIINFTSQTGDILEELQRAGCRNFHFIGDVPPGIPDIYSGTKTPFARFGALPIDTDILLVCAEHPSVEKTLAERMSRRHNAPLLLFDLTEKEVYCHRLSERYGLYVYGKEDIRHVTDYNRNERKSTLPAVERLVGEATTDFYNWLKSEQRFEFAGMLGGDSRMQRIFQLVSRIAPTDITVLIDGESGTGKELVARAVHTLSPRGHKQFYTVNCGAIPESLLESELFGHVRGAFTGAVVDKQGLFEAANGSTVFLDEIGELPLHLQVKLLRFLQEGEIKKVGGNDTLRLDVRVIAATNKNLAEMVEAGTFRSDLYYRLNVIQITLPPLRERRRDLPLLANHFLSRFAHKMQKDMMSFSPEAMRAITSYHWPGNIRELENAVERAVALTVGKSISLYNLPEQVRTTGQEPSPGMSVPATGEQMTLKDVEKKYILETLETCHWNYEAASKQLGIGRTTLWRKLREYGYSPE